MIEFVNYLFFVYVCFSFYYGFDFIFKPNRNYPFIILSSLVIAFVQYSLTFSFHLNKAIIQIIILIVYYALILINFRKMKAVISFVYFMLLSIITGLILIIFTQISDLFIISYEINYLLSTFIPQTLCLIIFYFISLYFSGFIRNLPNSLSIKFFQMLFFPSLMNIILITMNYEFNDYFFYRVFVILSIFSLLSTFFLSVKLINQEETKHKNQTLQNQLDATQQYIVMQDNQDTKIREMKHDIKNNLITSQALLQSNKLIELESYLSSLLGQLQNSQLYDCGNPYLNALINHKVYSNPSIQFQIHIRLKNKFGIDPLDLCTILFNLIDNAIDELNRNKIKPIITINAYFKNNLLFISVTNPLGNEKSLKTEKTQHQNHGLGLSIIKHLTEKYNGTMTIKQDNQFIVNIMLCEK